MIELKHVSKVFETAGGRVEALKDISLTIPDGDVYGIIGMSGAGKSTLVRCINMLERPTSGEIIVDGKRMDTMSPAQLRAARRGITMIFQRFNLLMQRNCLDNVCFPMELAGIGRREAAERALTLLETVGLPDKAKAYPAQLSGGQQQRVAIARALATNPKVLLCDEATSALDPKTTRQILELIGDINRKLGITVVIITHQMSVVKSVCSHVAILDDGEVVEDGLVSTVFSAPKSAAARHLVFPGGADITVSDPTQERRIRLVFRSAKTTSIPLVARLATEEGVCANVISASTQKLSEEIYGGMLLGIPAGQFERAWAFLNRIENLSVEEVSVDVQ
ncbi:ATP-binding cassette domain-containing protein [Oscillibacter valericigenes]|nr:ATP-binding cassette domain-containing protein [Oscillibacter valericigenes]